MMTSIIGACYRFVNTAEQVAVNLSIGIHQNPSERLNTIIVANTGF